MPLPAIVVVIRRCRSERSCGSVGPRIGVEHQLRSRIEALAIRIEVEQRLARNPVPVGIRSAPCRRIVSSGQLAEEACRVVGGNGLLARIGALYHDIGKTAAPEHFVENQAGKNPHDRLKPTQSAKIIISHVTYGVKLAREMGLPQRIIDFIPQHHGTRTLHYFLKKAQDEARDETEISENDFRYPGPKPQFKEAAIMMIADSCEAAARSLAEPTPENIRFIVTKIIDAILQDDQLGECDLTLRELTQIRESMIKSLVAIYHSRVDYPGYVPPTSGQFKISEDGDVSESEKESEAKYKYANPADIPISRGGEIEDEAIDRSHEPEVAKSSKTI